MTTFDTRRHGAADEPALGFFAHQRDDGTWRGALLVLDARCDPLDFAYTEPVSLNRLTLSLLGPRLEGYVIERVLVPPLLAKAGGGVRLLCFDDPLLLQRRVKLPVPCAVLAAGDAAHRDGAWVVETVKGNGGAKLSLWVVPDHREPALLALQGAMAELAPFGLDEPFTQLRAALADVGARR